MVAGFAYVYMFTIIKWGKKVIFLDFIILFLNSLFLSVSMNKSRTDNRHTTTPTHNAPEINIILIAVLLAVALCHAT
jgi:hypothetical protein